MPVRWAQWAKKPVGKVLESIAAPMTSAEFWKVRAASHMVTRESPILAAAQKMVAMDLSYLLVVDDNEGTVPMDRGRVLGLATDRNLLKWSLEHEGHTEQWRQGVPIGTVDAITTTTPNITCAKPESTVGDCLRLMNKKIFNHLPIIDESDAKMPRCRGILQLRDMLMPLESSEAEGLPHTIRFSPLKRLFPASAETIQEDMANLNTDAVWGEKTTAGDVLGMKRRMHGVTDATSLKAYMLERIRMHTLLSNATVKEAMHHLVHNKLTFVVVVSDTWEVQGIVTERDCVQAIGEAPFIDVERAGVEKVRAKPSDALARGPRPFAPRPSTALQTCKLALAGLAVKALRE